MLRSIFFLLLVFHGLIHLMGFTKAFNFAQVSQLTLPISKPAGAAWGIACLLFCATAFLFLLKKDVWWAWAAAAILLSQILIFMSWQDAKFGTTANLIVLLALAPAIGKWQFDHMAKAELTSFLTSPTPTSATISKEKIATLPPVVQRWLERSNVVDKPTIKRVHLFQKGEMRTAPDGKWMPVTAEQWFNTNPPGFIWLADVSMMPMVHLAGRDKYVDGRGHMLIKALSLVPVADSRGEKIDQGSMLRYLGELIWFPTAAVNDYLTWTEIDSTSAKATISHGGISAEGVFFFDKNGDMTAFEADRYYDRKGTATLERWRIEAKAWQEFEGVRMPVAFEVSWKLKEGDFTWFKLEVTNVIYDEAP